ncbi:MFS transporter [Streptomyces sp. CA2R101]|uniref:MFS transporter n=1 Tax=Streptomyces sp. CA2R101 TaxID=3120152 RepID=UPI00300BE2E4
MSTSPPQSTDADTTPETLRDCFAQLPPAGRTAVLGATLAVVFLSTLDAMVMGTALPRVIEELHGSESFYTWIVTAYLLASTAVLPLYGRYSDLYGRKPAMLIGLAVFLLGSALCALSASVGALIAFRTLQGVGAGALLAVGMTLLRDLFSMEAMKKLQVIMGTMTAAAFIGGPYLGGLLTDLLGWQSVFWLNLILGLPALGVIAVLLPAFRAAQAPRGSQDFLGMFLLIACVSLILLGFTEKSRTDDHGHVVGWFTPQVLGLLTTGAVLLVLFVVVEHRAAVPLLPLRLFRIRNYSAILTASFFFSISLFPAVVFLPLYFQESRDMPPGTSGMMIFPMMVGLVASNLICAPLVWKDGWARAVLGTGAVLLGVGSALFGLVTPSTSVAVLFPFMVLIGLGMGPSMAAVGLLAQNSVPRSDTGTATSSMMLFKAIGQAVGLAIGQSVFVRQLNAQNLVGHGSAEANASAITTTIQTVGVVGAVCAVIAVLFIKDMTMERWWEKPAPPRPDGNPRTAQPKNA